MKKLDFLEEELEDSGEVNKSKSVKANDKIGRIYEPIIGLQKLVIRVSDNGIGVEKHNYSKLFKLFGSN